MKVILRYIGTQEPTGVTVTLRVEQVGYPFYKTTNGISRRSYTGPPGPFLSFYDSATGGLYLREGEPINYRLFVAKNGVTVHTSAAIAKC